MVEKAITITNPDGLHGATATQFVSFLQKYHCEITFISGSQFVNAKSILNVLMLGLNTGSQLTIRVEGAEEEAVLHSILLYIDHLAD